MGVTINVYGVLIEFAFLGALDFYPLSIILERQSRSPYPLVCIFSKVPILYSRPFCSIFSAIAVLITLLTELPDLFANNSSSFQSLIGITKFAIFVSIIHRLWVNFIYKFRLTYTYNLHKMMKCRKCGYEWNPRGVVKMCANPRCRTKKWDSYIKPEMPMVVDVIKNPVAFQTFSVINELKSNNFRINQVSIAKNLGIKQPNMPKRITYLVDNNIIDRKYTINFSSIGKMILESSQLRQEQKNFGCEYSISPTSKTNLEKAYKFYYDKIKKKKNSGARSNYIEKLLASKDNDDLFGLIGFMFCDFIRTLHRPSLQKTFESEFNEFIIYFKLTWEMFLNKVLVNGEQLVDNELNKKLWRLHLELNKLNRGATFELMEAYKDSVETTSQTPKVVKRLS